MSYFDDTKFLEIFNSESFGEWHNSNDSFNHKKYCGREMNCGNCISIYAKQRGIKL